ncbi:MAG: hypothetical protein ISS15_14140 [Alphaproteobacteria bacterium]|nr:hypothetical protein [Alphaproteobacteria bacterium]MBL6937456.1 hypothetical protein [Alphaproteobacteria bacterium]MBL7098794.1 hypothetical protein [Alphaproteobacteria bacterium]
MSQDDLPPQKNGTPPDESTFAGTLGLTFTGLLWVAVFSVVGLVVLYFLVRWFGR